MLSATQTLRSLGLSHTILEIYAFIDEAKFKEC